MGQSAFKAIFPLAVPFLLLAPTSAALAQTEPKLLMTYSFDSVEGKFGQTQDTKAQAVTVAATIAGDGYRASLFVPYISLEGPGTLVSGTIAGAGGNPTRKSRGLGDIVATYSQDIVGSVQSKGFAASGTALVKFASGDEEEGLGTGKTDYALQADLAYRFQNGFGLTTVLGRNYYGRTAVLPLKNGNYYTVGANVQLSPQLLVNVTATERDELIANSGKRKERGVSAIYGLSPTSALQFAYTRGRSTASPDDVFSIGYIHTVE